MIIRGGLLLDPNEPPTPGWLRVESRRIAEVHLGAEWPPAAGFGREEPVIGGADRLICPAFVDAHIHLPQIDAIGHESSDLLDWLNRTAFPAEIWWTRGGAASMTRTAVRRMVHEGTLAFAGYLASDGLGTRRAIEQLEKPPSLRFAVGRVAMDREAPDELTAEDRWRASRRPTPSVAPAPIDSNPRGEISVNPRFAIACSDELLAEIGWLVSERSNVLVQTHLAETKQECARVAELFPNDANYTAVYDRFGLLTPRTLLAHCAHLGEDEWRLIKHRDSVVVHCPTANVFLESGLFDLEAAREHGIRLALGSDVAAGPDVAMPRVARAMIETAKTRRMTVASGASVPTAAEAWRLITQGNAEALGWSDQGRVEPGAWADLLVLRAPESWRGRDWPARLLYNWSSGLIETRIASGRVVDVATI